MNLWLNAIGYQLVWLAAVWGATHERGWLATAALLPFALVHMCRRDGHLDAWLMLAACIVGGLLDSLYAASGVVAYASPFPSPEAAPLWIVALWAAFALTLRHSLRFLRGRPLLAAAFGAVGAPLAYLAAARGGHAVQFPHGTRVAMGTLALGWAIVLPALMCLVDALERASAARRELAHG
jgi:hypothetical protein